LSDHAAAASESEERTRAENERIKSSQLILKVEK
jgi:hypothetical protein